MNKLIEEQEEEEYVTALYHEGDYYVKFSDVEQQIKNSKIKFIDTEIERLKGAKKTIHYDFWQNKINKEEMTRQEGCNEVIEEQITHLESIKQELL